MAKRFTDTDKWKREWFCDLPIEAKLAWIYLLDQCDHRGVWFRNFKLMSDQLGFVVNASFLETWFDEKVQLFENDKYFIPSFVEFQYSGGLNPGNRAHTGVLNLLEKIGPSKGLKRPSGGRKDTVTKKVKEEGECEGIFGPAALFEFWNANCSPLPVAKEFTKTRKDKASAQLKKYPDKNHWDEVLKKWLVSEFCLVTWKPGFDDFLNESKRIPSLEGRYDNRAKAAGFTGGWND